MTFEGISIKQRLYDIQNMPNMAKQLIGRGKIYDRLLSVILDKKNTYIYLGRSITIKEIAEIANLTYDKTRRHISMIYEDLLNYEDEHIKFSIEKLIYIFIFRHYDNYLEITLDNLPFIP